MLDAATFCHPDSASDPTDFATADAFDLAESLLRRPHPDPLACYIEAHVHARVRLVDDVEALVLDPCYRGTRRADVARTLPVMIEWQDAS